MKQIIIVDDEVQITELIKTYLLTKKDDSGNPQFDVKIFHGGNDCIDYLKLGTTPDLILSDMRMPEGEGMDIIKYVSGENKNVPIFIMTGFSGDYKTEDILASGAKKVLAKPFKFKDLADQIETYLKAG